MKEEKFNRKYIKYRFKITNTFFNRLYTATQLNILEETEPFKKQKIYPTLLYCTDTNRMRFGMNRKPTEEIWSISITEDKIATKGNYTMISNKTPVIYCLSRINPFSGNIEDTIFHSPTTYSSTIHLLKDCKKTLYTSSIQYHNIFPEVEMIPLSIVESLIKEYNNKNLAINVKFTTKEGSNMPKYQESDNLIVMFIKRNTNHLKNILDNKNTDK